MVGGCPSSSPEVAVHVYLHIVLNSSMATAFLESCHNFVGDSEMLYKIYQSQICCFNVLTHNCLHLGI